MMMADYHVCLTFPTFFPRFSVMKLNGASKSIVTNRTNCFRFSRSKTWSSMMRFSTWRIFFSIFHCYEIICSMMASRYYLPVEWFLFQLWLLLFQQMWDFWPESDDMRNVSHPFNCCCWELPTDELKRSFQLHYGQQVSK